MFMWRSLKSLFSPLQLLECSLWTGTCSWPNLALNQFLRVQILGLMAGLQPHHSYNTHSQVVMRFTLSPEHHSADDSSWHSRGILSSLEKKTPSPFSNAAHRYGPPSCVQTEWELSLKILIKTTWVLQWLILIESSYISTLLWNVFQTFSLSSQYIWN